MKASNQSNRSSEDSHQEGKRPRSNKKNQESYSHDQAEETKSSDEVAEFLHKIFGRDQSLNLQKEDKMSRSDKNSDEDSDQEQRALKNLRKTKEEKGSSRGRPSDRDKSPSKILIDEATGNSSQGDTSQQSFSEMRPATDKEAGDYLPSDEPGLPTSFSGQENPKGDDLKDDFDGQEKKNTEGVETRSGSVDHDVSHNKAISSSSPGAHKTVTFYSDFFDDEFNLLKNKYGYSPTETDDLLHLHERDGVNKSDQATVFENPEITEIMLRIAIEEDVIHDKGDTEESLNKNFKNKQTGNSSHRDTSEQCFYIFNKRFLSVSIPDDQIRASNKNLYEDSNQEKKSKKPTKQHHDQMSSGNESGDEAAEFLTKVFSEIKKRDDADNDAINATSKQSSYQMCPSETDKEAGAYLPSDGPGLPTSSSGRDNYEDDDPIKNFDGQGEEAAPCGNMSGSTATADLSEGVEARSGSVDHDASHNKATDSSSQRANNADYNDYFDEEYNFKKDKFGNSLTDTDYYSDIEEVTGSEQTTVIEDPEIKEMVRLIVAEEKAIQEVEQSGEAAVDLLNTSIKSYQEREQQFRENVKAVNAYLEEKRGSKQRKQLNKRMQQQLRTKLRNTSFRTS